MCSPSRNITVARDSTGYKFESKKGWIHLLYHNEFSEGVVSQYAGFWEIFSDGVFFEGVQLFESKRDALRVIKSYLN